MENQISKKSQPSRPRYWQAHIKALSESGLSRAEYCRQQKLSYHTLIYWQRKFSPRDKSSLTLVPVTFTTEQARPGSQSGDAGLKILLPGDIAIGVSDHFSPATLARLLKLLGDR